MAIKVNPIRNNNVINRFIKHKVKQKHFIDNNISSKLPITTVVGTELLINNFMKDFQKTVAEENYFQFKLDNDNGKPYSPDVFQTASAMNLYLGKDVLVTAPTGTGKTAIAQYVITKNLKEGARTFYTTPLKALSNEKYKDFCKIYGKDNVGIITGDTKFNTSAPIIIMTCEVYRNMTSARMFNHRKEKDALAGLKTVIFDELQYLGDTDRGGVWEQSIMFTPQKVQILSLSATIGNNIDINNWIASTKKNQSVITTPTQKYLPNRNLKETVLINVPSENRHVPLSFEIENVASELKIPKGGSKSEKIKAKKEAARLSQSIYAKPSKESFKLLTKKLNDEGKLPAIYFVFSKRTCKQLLKYLSEEGEILTSGQEKEEISKIIQNHIDNGVYLGEGLDIKALMNGYAIHNSSLLPSQKALIEELFQKKLIKVVLATETLSAGINMPAKTTVISSPRKPSSTSDGGEDKKRNLTANEFHQMAGRCGRRGIDTQGYCYIMSCNQEQKKLYDSLIKSPSNELESNLDLDYAFIANYISDYIDKSDLERILSKSLYVYNSDGSLNKENLKTLIKLFELKKGILFSNNYIDLDGITTKGKLIKYLNGYEQIPIINILTNKTLKDLNPVQIAGIIGGLANIDIIEKSNLPYKEKISSKIDDISFINALFSTQKQIKDYEYSISKLYPERELEFSSNVVDHIYTWAELNSKDENSRDNWKSIYKEDKLGIRDEGSLFKEITMTSDLLKQLIDITNYAIEFSNNIDDKEYYKILSSKLQEALDLIQREPAKGY